MHWNSCINVSFLIVQEWGFARSAGPVTVFLKAFIDSRAPSDSLNGKLFHGPMIYMTEEQASHHVEVLQSVFDNG